MIKKHSIIGEILSSKAFTAFPFPEEAQLSSSKWKSFVTLIHIFFNNFQFINYQKDYLISFLAFSNISFYSFSRLIFFSYSLSKTSVFSSKLYYLSYLLSSILLLEEVFSRLSVHSLWEQLFSNSCLMIMKILNSLSYPSMPYSISFR